MCSSSRIRYRAKRIVAILGHRNDGRSVTQSPASSPARLSSPTSSASLPSLSTVSRSCVIPAAPGCARDVHKARRRSHSHRGATAARAVPLARAHQVLFCVTRPIDSAGHLAGVHGGGACVLLRGSALRSSSVRYGIRRVSITCRREALKWRGRFERMEENCLIGRSRRTRECGWGSQTRTRPSQGCNRVRIP